MAKRKVGNNKRQPRMTAAGTTSKCIRYFADDPSSAEFFTPKPKPKQMQLRKRNGKYEVVKVERALL